MKRKLVLTEKQIEMIIEGLEYCQARKEKSLNQALNNGSDWDDWYVGHLETAIYEIEDLIKTVKGDK